MPNSATFSFFGKRWTLLASKSRGELTFCFSCLQIPRSAYTKARRGIREGEGQYEVETIPRLMFAFMG